MGVFSGNNCNFANRDGVREILITLPFSLLTGLEPPIKAMVYTGASRNAKLKGRGAGVGEALPVCTASSHTLGEEAATTLAW